MLSVLALSFAATVGLVAFTRSAQPEGPTGTFVTHVYANGPRQSMTYYLYTPAHYDPAKKYPLVLVLHGGGERANPKQTAQQNRQKLLSQYYVQAFAAPTVQDRWPCFVVVPQVVGSQRWVNVPASQSAYHLAPQPSASLTLAMDIVDSLRHTYAAIDGNRIYVAGISMGGFGVWEAIERWPNTFAAALPISGAGDPSHAAALRGFPIWAFHGAADPIVPVAGSRTMVQAIRDAGGSPCYTEYPGAGHGIWNTQRMLSEPKVLAWLFSQTRAPNKRAPPESCPA